MCTSHLPRGALLLLTNPEKGQEMKKQILYILAVALALVIVGGCGKKADENKPMPEVRSEAEQMGTSQLRATAMKYKEAIAAKRAEVEKLVEQLSEIPIAEKLGEEAANIKKEMDSLKESIDAFKERFQVYYDKLKEKNSDLTGLE